MPSDEQFPAAATALSEYQRIEQQMSDPAVASDPNAMRKLGRRHAELGSIVTVYREYQHLMNDLVAAQEMASEDSDFAEE
ncbi:MAG: PCRF domain-containing protein, partial [Bifidobacterium crudilactis]|nr:PCRF domain-containing protein [Bifidobacterium crudilactis]